MYIILRTLHKEGLKKPVNYNPRRTSDRASEKKNSTFFLSSFYENRNGLTSS